MVLWMIGSEGEHLCLVDRYRPSLFVGGSKLVMTSRRGDLALRRVVTLDTD